MHAYMHCIFNLFIFIHFFARTHTHIEREAWCVHNIRIMCVRVCVRTKKIKKEKEKKDAYSNEFAHNDIMAFFGCTKKCCSSFCVPLVHWCALHTHTHTHIHTHL